jgi:hypothetical protein
MDLENVDVCPEPLHARLYGVKDVLPTQADLIYNFAVVRVRLSDWAPGVRFVDAKVAFGKDDDLAPWDVELLQRFGYDPL